MCPVRSVTYVSGPDLWDLERAMGIEPTSEAWEASILPLYDARSARSLRIASGSSGVQLARTMVSVRAAFRQDFCIRSGGSEAGIEPLREVLVARDERIAGTGH